MKLTRLLGSFFFSLAIAANASDTAAQTGDVTLKVGVVPITDVAPLYVGVAMGFFKDEHLLIEPVPAQSGAAIVPAVISGDDQIGFSNMVSLILAAAHGLPVMAVAYGAGINEQRG
jgi:NitT/TauT family transport system substrate-binding protein